MFGEVAKWVEEIDAASRVPEFMSRAFHEAVAGRPGPVVLTLPEDMLREETTARNPSAAVPVDTHPGAADIAALGRMLAEAERPFVIVGGARWDASAVAGLRRFAERFDLPVGCSLRRQGLFDHDHPNYAGDVGIAINPALARRVKEADLVLLVGGRMSEMPSSGYTLMDVPEPRQKLVHVFPAAEELGRVYRPALAINATPSAFVAAIQDMVPPEEEVRWSAQMRQARADYEAWTEPVKNAGAVQLSSIVTWLRGRLPDDAIITNGAGNFATWMHRFFRFRRPATQAAPCSGTMGYAMPAALAAKLLHPDRVVICWTGDGDFQMTLNEFQTAVQYGAAVIVVVVNNGVYGTIRMHQERDYPDRVIATDVTSPDYAALARANGGHGERVASTEEFAPAFERALQSGKPAIIEVLFEKEAITPSASLSTIRGKGRR